VIAMLMGHLAPEHVIAPGGVHQDEGDDEQRADQCEALALRRRGGAAAAQMDIKGGMMFGHRLMPRPL